MTAAARGASGRAFVEIVGDVSKFGPEVERKLNAVLREVGLQLNFGPIADAGGRGGKETGERFGKEFDREAVKGVKRTGEKAAKEVVTSMAAHADSPGSRGLIRRAFATLGRVAVNAAMATGTGFANFAQSLGGGIQSGLSSLGSLIPTITAGSASIGLLLIKLGALVIVIPTLIGFLALLAIQLVGLVGLLNALPAAGGIALAAIIPLIVAFQNMGEALSAVMEGDPDKIAEALKKLSPAARAFVRDFAGLLPFFRELQKLTQQAFFAPLTKSLSDMFGVIGPEVTAGFTAAAGALGKLVAAIAALGTTVNVKNFLGDLLGSNQTGQIGAIGRIIDQMTPSVVKLLDAITRAADSSLPIVEKMFGSFAEGMGSFADAINRAVEDGSFNEFLNDGIEIGGLLKDLLFELLGVFKTLFDETKDGGKDFLREMITAIQDLNEWLQSPEGRDALNELIRLANTFLEILKLVVGALGSVLAFMGRIDATADIVLGKLGLIERKGLSAKGIGSAVATAAAGLRGLAAGGLVTQPTFALVGEAGPEAVVPLNDPARAQQVMAQAGLLDLAGGMAATAGMLVQVFLGTREITDILDTRVSRGLARTARSLSQGTRPAEGT